MDLWNVGKHLSDYTAFQPRRQPSSYITFELQNTGNDNIFTKWTHIIPVYINTLI
jgi:hypothetical protein